VIRDQNSEPLQTCPEVGPGYIRRRECERAGPGYSTWRALLRFGYGIPAAPTGACPYVPPPSGPPNAALWRGLAPATGHLSGTLPSRHVSEVAAGHVNSGQRAYQGRGNPRAISSTAPKSTQVALPRSVGRGPKPCCPPGPAGNTRGLWTAGRWLPLR
jgi:hypothetical protein